MLAAQGVAGVRVRRRPRVVLLSSGRELRGLGESLEVGQSHDSNMPMLAALLAAWGAHVRPLPIVGDNSAAMRNALETAAEDADLILTTAGISVGDEDHVRAALHDLGGNLAVLSVAMKPGKPLAAGKLGDAVFIGLPGNPMAALAGAVAFVRPLLARMTGTAPAAAIRAHASFETHRKPGRTEFIPVCLRQEGACLWAERVGPDGSARLGPLPGAAGLAVLPAKDADIRRGTMLDVMPLIPAATWCLSGIKALKTPSPGTRVCTSQGIEMQHASGNQAPPWHTLVEANASYTDKLHSGFQGLVASPAQGCPS